MPAAPLLSDEEIAERLKGHPAWERHGDTIVRLFTLKDFRDALSFVNEVADVADAQDHHPDIEISWNKLQLKVWTHVSGGITERDFRLASAVDEIAAKRGL
jgi:4a-hydroxytetrahydrobiopterin dehydratase